MKSKIKISIVIIAIIVLFFVFYKKGTEIVFVYGDSIYVKNFPSDNAQQLKWWRDNRDLLKRKYDIPHNPNEYVMTIMDFGSGYEEKPDGGGFSSFDKSPEDYSCFENIKGPKNCIYNETLLLILNNGKRTTIMANEHQYVESPDGKLKLIKTNAY